MWALMPLHHAVIMTPKPRLSLAREITADNITLGGRTLVTPLFKNVVMDKAITIANNDTVFLSWTLDQKIDGRLGFAVYRKDSSRARAPLPAWVGFKDGSNPDWVHMDTTSGRSRSSTGEISPQHAARPTHTTSCR